MPRPLFSFPFPPTHILWKFGGLFMLFLQACTPPPVSLWIPEDDYTILYPSDWKIKLEDRKLLVFPETKEESVVTISVYPQARPIDSQKAQAIISSLYAMPQVQIEVNQTSDGRPLYFDYAHLDTLRDLHNYTQLRQHSDKLALITAHSPQDSPKRIQKRLIRIAQSFRFVIHESHRSQESL